MALERQSSALARSLPSRLRRCAGDSGGTPGAGCGNTAMCAGNEIWIAAGRRTEACGMTLGSILANCTPLGFDNEDLSAISARGGAMSAGVALARSAGVAL